MAATSNVRSTNARTLPVLDPSQSHTFIKPVKKINEGHDVPAFLMSKAYADIVTFVMQLNVAMCPRKVADDNSHSKIQSWELNSPAVTIEEPVRKLMDMLREIESIIEQAPPATGPRRFGNVSFRKFYEILEEKIPKLLDDYLPTDKTKGGVGSGGATAKDELSQYLMGAFGSSQRLDYGTGHELSFLAFLGCIWKLGGFPDSQDENTERSIVIGVIEVYLQLIRRLILTYTLEPAGSHGVWGLDDHSFLPYIVGSAQFCPPIEPGENMPLEGALANAPNPSDIAKKNIVDRERKTNMYFAAVGFINDVKTGPFWEHSPILFDISGVKAGWGKINKGMLKMYNAEVLSKFPVVQHFPFGSLFSWEQDPDATAPPSTVHTSSQPSSHSISVTSDTGAAPTSRHPAQESTKAPWASKPASSGFAPTAAPWASKPTSSGFAPTAAPWANRSQQPPPSQTMMPPNRAPWAKPGGSDSSNPTPSTRNTTMEGTKAPWAK